MKAIEVEGAVGRISSRADKSLSFSVSTPELSVGERSEFFAYQGVVAKFFIRPLTEPIDDKIEVKGEIGSKTPSQRLRAVLFVFFKQLSEKNQLAPGTLFEDFYAQQIHRMIEDIKGQLDEH